MEWKGEAKKLHAEDIRHAAEALGCDVAAIKAVMAVECKGSGFDKEGRLVILFEPHIFHRELSKNHPDKLPTAVKQKLAAKSWGAIKYGKMSEQYGRIDKAIMIDENSALRSASYGLGQTMGFNDARCGFKSAQAMVEAYKDSEAAQLMGMVNFITSSHLDDELRRHDWAGFAHGYNGSGYKKNHYDEKLAAAHRAAK
jgi:hypothetical protein